jgi:HPt (histidine-containing phosphotransfer) domain-containing protein
MPPDGPVINQQLLASYRELQADGTSDVVMELIDIFLEDLPHRLAELQSAVAGGDPTRARSAAHRLKGGAASVGAARLAAVLAQLEATCGTAAREGADRAGFAPAADLVDAALAEAASAREALLKERNAPQGGGEPGTRP